MDEPELGTERGRACHSSVDVQPNAFARAELTDGTHGIDGVRRGCPNGCTSEERNQPSRPIVSDSLLECFCAHRPTRVDINEVEILRADACEADGLLE